MTNRIVHRIDVECPTAFSYCGRGFCTFMRVLVCAVSLLIPALSLSASDAEQTADSVKILFEQGKSLYNPDLGNNRAALADYISRISNLNREGRLGNIEVKGYVSPDGTTSVNRRLATDRCNVLADLISEQTDIRRSDITTTPIGINWAELRRIIQSRPDVPSRAQLLDLIDNTPLWLFDKQGNIVGGRIKSLMDLQGGAPYRWLYINVFPEMRNAVAISYSVAAPVADRADSLNTSTSDSAQAITFTPQAPIEQAEAQDYTTMITPEAERIDILAVKTNLLYYPILMPNIELEWMVNNKWSVALEWQGAWYAKENPHKVYRLSTVIPEVRYWAISRDRWHGMYVGLFAGGGLYDLCNGKPGKPGHEGEGFLGGLSVGYMWPISKHLSFDAGIGLGYLRARDKEYLPRDGHYLYQLTKNINYFGPLRVKFSLVWRFYSIKKKDTFGK